VTLLQIVASLLVVFTPQVLEGGDVIKVVMHQSGTPEVGSLQQSHGMGHMSMCTPRACVAKSRLLEATH